MNKLKFIVLTIVFLAGNINSSGQILDYKQKGLDEGKSRNFSLAIKYLKQALEDNPDDAEIYFHLGKYSHYIVYDSRPFVEQGNEWSKNEVIKNFEKAIELKPDYKLAYYFLGVEYGARAIEALKVGNIKQFKSELICGRNSGGYPDWLLEYSRNVLNSCEENAILFLFGDLMINSVSYIQNIEEYRTDIIAISPFLLERPSYAMLYKKGVTGVLNKAPISWTETHIMDMHPYQWRKQIIEIPISDSYMKRYKIPEQNNIMKWELNPDIYTYSLNAGGALLANIIETNKWERSIYFAFGTNGSIYDLNDYFQISGIVNKLLPIKVNNTELIYDLSKTESILLNPLSYNDFSDLAVHNLGYNSEFIPYNYRKLLLDLAQYYYKKGNSEKALSILDKMEKLMPESAHPTSEYLVKEIDKLKEVLNEKQ